MSDFEINGETLARYVGDGGVVCVPDTVNAIADRAFDRQSKVTEIVLPDGIQSIGSFAFSGTGIKRIALPPSLENVGSDVFFGCAQLQEVIVSEGVRKLGERLFLGCSSLRRVELPASIETIAGVFKAGGPGWLGGDSELRAPKAAEVVVMPHIAEKASTGEQMDVSLVACLTNDVDVLAHVLAFQSHAGWMKAVEGKSTHDNAAEVFSDAIALVSEGDTLTTKKASQLVAYAVSHSDCVDGASVRKLHELLRDGGRKLSKALAQLEGDQRVMSTEAQCQEEAPTSSIESLVADLLDEFGISSELRGKIGRGCLISDGSGESSPEAVQLLVDLSKVNRKGVYTARYSSTNYHRCSFLSGKDELGRRINELAALFDKNALSDYLEQLFYEQHVSEALVALCRFGNDEAVKRLVESMKAWDKWDGNGNSRKDLAIARGALMYNDSMEAMRHFESIKMLSWYASAHGMTEDALRDNTLSNFGFDRDGKRVFDLGTKIVTATIGDDLKIELFDDDAGKAVRSIPKRGADPVKYEAAKAELAEMRKQIRTIVKQRKDLLLEDFLSGRERRIGAWKAAYLENPVLRSVARLIVWQKGDVTFTVMDGETVDATGTPVKLPAGGVKVAHPVEMKKADIEAWRAYFATRGLRQPFAQVWEKVVPKTSIKKDRYKGYPIPVYRFKGQEKHGIRLDLGGYRDSAVSISFGYDTAKCEIKQLDFEWHSLKNRVEITSFSPVRGASPRKLNHLVAILDRMCFYPRLATNDLTVMDDLNDPTLEQLIDYANIASENGATELAAALLAYREERFPEYGSIESLLL